MAVTIEDVKRFWDRSPLCAEAISARPGTPEFFRHYDRLREINEPVDFSYNLHEFPTFAGKMVLDVGCGNGYVVSHYALEGARAHGVDVSRTAVDITRSRLGHMGLSADVRTASAEALPFEDNTFDCVCSMGVLHHTPDTQKALDEVCRVLRPGGRVILMFYNKDSVLYRWSFALMPWTHPKHLGKSRQTLVNQVDGAQNPKGDVYSEADLRKMLPEVDHLVFFRRLLQPWMVWPVGRILPQGLLAPFERRWGWFLYAKGWKHGERAGSEIP